MDELIKQIQKLGMYADCGTHVTYAIAYNEAKAIILYLRQHDKGDT